MTTDQGTAGGVELELTTLVTPTSQGLNPNAHVFQSKLPATPSTFSIVQYDDGFESVPSTPLTPAAEADYQYVNGDLGKANLGQVASPPQSPDPTAAVDAADYDAANGLQANLAAVPGAPAAINPEAMEFESAAMLDHVTPPPPPSPAGHDGSDVSSLGGDESEPGLDVEALTVDQLKSLLTQQLEYYFSRENLASDTYLMSQMDGDQYVPIWTVANFNQIRRLTKDLKLIVDVLRESPNVQVDEAGERVRPNHKRCIVILREIPDSTPLEEVANLFRGEKCPKFASCEFAHNNSWYVTFGSDEDAQCAYRYLREEVKTFKGNAIMARIKAKPFARSTFAAKNGYRPPAEHNAYQQQLHIQTQQQQQQVQSQLTPQQQQQQQQQPTQHQQPHTSHQQQRYMAGYGASAVPSNLSYSSQPVYVNTFTPFYHPTLLQTWTPQSQCFDIASAYDHNGFFVDVEQVFSMNGLAPQAAYKPVNGAGNGGRSNYAPRPTHPKCHPRGHRLLSEGGRSESRTHGHHHHNSHHHHHHHHSLLLPMGAGYGSSATPRGVGTRSASMDSLLAKWSTTAAEHQPPLRSGAGVSSSSSSTLLTATPAIAVAVGSDRREDTTTQTLSSALLYRQPDDQSALGGLPSRMRHRRTKRKDDDTMSNEGRRSYQERSKSPAFSTKEEKPLPKFDLEASAFPPLPGTVESPNGARHNDAEDVFENRMADVVKGTAKPSTRDTKTQTSAPLSPVFLPAVSSPAAPAAATPTKEGPALTNGDALTSVFTPPRSPSPPISRNPVAKATKTDDFLINGENQGTKSTGIAEPAPAAAASFASSCAASPPSNAGRSRSSASPAAAAAASPPATMATVVAASSAPITNGDISAPAMVSSSSTRPASATPPAAAAAMVPKPATAVAASSSPLTATNKVAPTNSISDSTPVRLSYAQMAQRAKDKVEKLVQEHKEKQDTQERERRVKERELATASTFNSNSNQKQPAGGPQRNAPLKDGRPSPREKAEQRDRYRKFRTPPKEQKENEYAGGEERWRSHDTPSASSN